MLCYLKKLNSETLLKSWARNLLYHFVGYCAFQIWYFNSYAWKSTWTIGLYVFQIETGNSNFQDVLHSNEELWKQTVDRMVVLWDLVRKGGALSLPSVGNVTGYPGVFQGNPHPHPSKPAPASTGTGLTGTGAGFSQTRGEILLK